MVGYSSITHFVCHSSNDVDVFYIADTPGSALGGAKVLRLLQEPSVWIKTEGRASKSIQVHSTAKSDLGRVENVENRPVAVCVAKSVAISKKHSELDCRLKNYPCSLK